MIKLHLIGRQTEDPTQNQVNGISVVNFSVAANTKVKDDEGKYVPNFFRVAVWRQMGENCMRYLHKGDRVAVIGDLELRTYTDTKGNPRSAMQVTATDVEFISDKRTNEPGKDQPAPAQQTAFPSSPIIPGASDGLPF